MPIDIPLHSLGPLLPVVAALLGLVVGSFLNVVILRLPAMMKRRWRQDCAALLSETDDSPGGQASDSTVDTGGSAADSPPERLTLAHPGSRCPHCQAPIRPWQNIPVLSYLLLRGRCGACGTAISLRYPIVELLTAIASVTVALHASSWIELGAWLGITWTLIALTGIDIDEQLLPDDLTLPLLWAGLIYNTLTGATPLAESVLGAAGGYLLLWSIYWLFKIVTGKEGMGYGDFKLLAALGAWLGVQSLALIILLSSLVGALVGIGLIVFRGQDRAQPIPFGPYLAAAGWIALLWGPAIIDAYLGSMG